MVDFEDDNLLFFRERAIEMMQAIIETCPVVAVECDIIENNTLG